MHTQRIERRADDKLVGGVLLMVIGAAFLLDNAGLLRVDSVFSFWPLLLAWMGYRKLRFPQETGDRESGLWLLTLGLLFQLLNLGPFGLSWPVGWPLLLVALGILLIWKSLALPPYSKTDHSNAG